MVLQIACHPSVEEIRLKVRVCLVCGDARDIQDRSVSKDFLVIEIPRFTYTMENCEARNPGSAHGNKRGDPGPCGNEDGRQI